MIEMMRKLTIFGSFGVLAYVIHVLVGGLLWEGFNHLNQPISDLTASGAPDRGLLSIITLIYGMFSIVFSVCAYAYIKDFAPRVSKIGMLLFLGLHIISITYGFFPQDLPGAPVTFKGIMHLVVTGLIIPLTILAPILVGKGLRKISSFRSYGNYSVITGIIIFITGGITAVFFVNKLPYFGLVERINIGVLQLWMFVTSIKLFTSKEYDKFINR
jgi:hypothetical membrane protein